MKFKFFVFLLLLTSSFVFAQKEVDRIVAVVDNEIILQSELDYQVKLMAAQKKVDSDMPGLQAQILNQMIEEKLAYAQALLDSVQVTDEEVNQRIDYQVNYFIQQYGSKEKVEQLYGMSLEKIKRTLDEPVRKQILVQRMEEKKFGDVDATRMEVESFFSTYKDSIGVIPEKINVAHIFINPKITDKMKGKYKILAQSILDSIKKGADFSELAKKYSEDPGSASEGGDLGWVGKGVFYPEFEAAAFALNKGALSDIVESPVGFHIIQMIDRRGDKIHVRHILIKIKKGDQADLSSIELLTNLRDSIAQKKGTFEEFAKKYSEDKETAPYGGDLGTFFMSQLDQNMLDVISKMKEGDISFPKRIDYGKDNYGYHIILVKKRIAQHTAGLDTDYPEIKKLADQYKKQKLYDAWIKKLKDRIYWKVML
ncbi:MAG: peptidylprolyl isomerase [Ignavibacteriaceae bacterium]|nr:peptidylprolyl isomerase [Ignavibacteriaceae bacterium]